MSELLGLLNRAFADEWLAHYQYLARSEGGQGPMKEA